MVAVDESRMINNTNNTNQSQEPPPILITNNNCIHHHINNNKEYILKNNNNNNNGLNILPTYIEKKIVRIVLIDRIYTPLSWKLRLALVCKRWFGVIAEELPQQISLRLIDLYSIRDWKDQSNHQLNPFVLWPTLHSLYLPNPPERESSVRTVIPPFRKLITTSSSSSATTTGITNNHQQSHYQNENISDQELRSVYASVKSVEMSLYDQRHLDRLCFNWSYFQSLSHFSVYSHISCVDLINSLRQQVPEVDGKQITSLNLQCYGVDLTTLIQIIEMRAPLLESLSFQMNENENTIEPFLNQLSSLAGQTLVRLEISSRTYIDFSGFTDSFPHLSYFKYKLTCKPSPDERANQLSLFRFIDLSPTITELSIQEQSNNQNEWIDLIRRKPLIRKLTLLLNNNNITSNGGVNGQQNNNNNNNNGNGNNQQHHHHLHHNNDSISQPLPTTLQYLKLSQSNPKYSLDFVRLFTHLTKISIDSLGTRCISELSSFISSTQILTSFKLNYWVNQHPSKQPIESQLEPLYSAIKNNSSLRLLAIRDYEFSIQAFSRLAQALEINQSLLFVQVRFFNMNLPKSFELILSKKVKQNNNYLVRTLYRVFK